jgi:hypothetical protein
MWEFNWGLFWALMAYGALKFAFKRVFGFYSAQPVQVVCNHAKEESAEVRQQAARLESMTGPPPRQP